MYVCTINYMAYYVVYFTHNCNHCHRVETQLQLINIITIIINNANTYMVVSKKYRSPATDRGGPRGSG